MQKSPLERKVYSSELSIDATSSEKEDVTSNIRGYLVLSGIKVIEPIEEQLTLNGRIDFVYYTEKRSQNESK